MSGNPQGHLHQSTQRRFRRFFVIAFLVMALVGTPFIVSGELRLNVAHRFDLAPGGKIEQIAGD